MSALYIILLLLGLYLIYQIQKTGLSGQLGGDYIISTNIIDEGSSEILAQDILTENVFMGDFRTADYTDANLSRSEINTIINGPSYLKDELANMYFTGNDVDGIGNFTVDGTNRVQGQPQPRRIAINQVGNGNGLSRGQVIEANSWKMVDFRPRSNDRAFRIMRAGVKQLDVMQIFDFMGRPSFVLRIKGLMPTACNQLRILPVLLKGSEIKISIYSIVDPVLLCTQDVREWQVTIPLQQLPNGKYNIVLNNQVINTLF
jgi:hypothetical protein